MFSPRNCYYLIVLLFKDISLQPELSSPPVSEPWCGTIIRDFLVPSASQTKHNVQQGKVY